MSGLQLAPPAKSPVSAPVAGGINVSNGTASNGTDTGMNSRFVFTAHGDISEPSFAFPNLSIGGNGETPTAPTNSLSPIATLEYPTGVFTSLRFNGLKTPTIDPFGYLWGVADGIYIPSGATYVVHTYLTVTAGQTWYLTGYADGGITATGGTGETDKTTTSALVGSYNRAYGPIAVRDKYVPSNALSIAGFGDSLMGGTGDSTVQGWFGRAFANYRRVKWGMNGEKVSGNVGQGGSRRLALSAGCNACFYNFGTNDYSFGGTAAATKANLVLGYRQRVARGMTVYTATMPPQTTSTDSWATTGNQTKTANEAIRVDVNQWIRAGCPIDPTALTPVAVGTPGALVAGAAGHPVKRVYDFSSVWETSQDSGIWIAGATSDGIHPKDAYHQNAANLISVPQVLADVGAIS